MSTSSRVEKTCLRLGAKEILSQTCGPSTVLYITLCYASKLEAKGLLHEKQVNTILSLITLSANAGAHPNFDVDTARLLIVAPSHHAIQESLLNFGWQCPPTSLTSIFFYLSQSTHAELRYRNLDAPEGMDIKVPHRMHYIWLTHWTAKREMFTTDISNICSNREKFAQRWHTRVFTNDPSLIPISRSKLLKCGVVLTSIYDYRYELKGFSTIEHLIEQKKWGMASDLLRYSLVWHFGGVYADVNFQLHRSLDAETLKYHFFSTEYAPSQAWVNMCCFGAAPHHPILGSLLESVESGLHNPPKSISSLENQRDDGITDTLTATPMTEVYYRAAHINGTIDVVYPYACADLKCFETPRPDLERSLRPIALTSCPKIKAWLERHSDSLDIQDLCGIPEQHLFGLDNQSSNCTWCEQ